MSKSKTTTFVPDQNLNRPQLERFVDDYLNRERYMCSPEYRLGMIDLLAHRALGTAIPTRFKSCTAQADAHLAGIEHGWTVWEEIKPFRQLKKLKEIAPRHFHFSVTALDEISAGINLEQHRLCIIDGTYLSDFEPKVHWWLALWEALVEESPNEYGAASRLADDVISRWATVRLERPGAEKLAGEIDGAEFDALFTKTTDADLDLLKRYHRLTRFLCELAAKFLPKEDLGWLCVEA
jgi:hypothetical protein